MRVLIAGGGVAGLETALALRDLAEERVELAILAPETHFWYRALSVADSFGLGRLHGVELVDLCSRLGADLTLGALGSVDCDAHIARTARGAAFEYDVLVVATGARSVPAIDGAFTFRGPSDGEPLQRLLAEEIASSGRRHVVFAIPTAVSWPLPAYELALATAEFVERSEAEVNVTIVTPEDAPLGLFGAAASRDVAELLAQAGVALLTETHPVGATEGHLAVTPGHGITADRVVALPRIEGAPVPGLPRDSKGFLRTDPHGRVQGVDDVFAAGDVTAFPIKQGGLAAAQADAVAESVAAMVRPELVPEPFRPVLRGLLLTGRAPFFMRADLTGGGGESSIVGTEPLWWPPGKIAGRYLGPFLAEWAGVVLSPPSEGAALAVEAEVRPV